MPHKVEFEGPGRVLPVHFSVEQFETIRQVAFDERRTRSALIRDIVNAWIAGRQNGGKPKKKVKA